MQPDKKRRKQVADAKIQFAVARRFAWHICVFFAVASLLGLLVQFLANPLQGFSHCWSSFWSTSGPYLVVLMAMLPMFIWDTLKLTNRIVGPICRLRTTIRRINRGEEPAPIQFRDGDFWQDLAADLNALTERLRQAERERDGEDRQSERAESGAFVAS
jgi:hypothetical protein